MLKILKSLHQHTLNSVFFGITLMVLVALYVAIGSGLPGVREHFEMTELPFFNAWPFKLLMWLLCLNLATVTFTRIPFTPPRYGVWTIHTGIVVLIFGMGFYYRNKVEGLAIVMKHGSTQWFYDKDERALHMRIGGVPVLQHPLPDLPRFHEYGEQYGNESYLRRSDLTDIVPFIQFAGKDGQEQTRKLSTELGLPDNFHVDVVGYYPYANVKTTFSEDASDGPAGLRLNIPNPHAAGESNQYLIGSDAQAAATVLGDVEFEDRPASAEDVKAVEEAAGRVHRLDVKAPGYEGTLYVEPGKSYELGSSGYALTIESFDPDFPAMNGEHVKLLTFMVKAPAQTFRRQVIFGRTAPTDWKLGVPGSGPMGKRQTEPLDDALETQYTFSDPFNLVSRQAPDKKTILAGEDGSLTVVSTSTRGASTTQHFEAGAKATVSVAALGMADAMKVNLIPVAHVRKEQSVEVVPHGQRDSRAGEEGIFQVLMVKVTEGSWSKVVPVPYVTWPAESGVQWEGASVTLPGTQMELQLALGQTRLPLPARVTLDNFELVKYPGTIGDNGIMRDFKSTITIDPREGVSGPTGPRTTQVAHMNSPVYWGGLGDSYWTFFQAQWDPNGQRYTVLGVGNRPGVWIMVTGCVMIVVGLGYAFYLKPVIIARMKKKALAAAAERAKGRKAGKAKAEGVGV